MDSLKLASLYSVFAAIATLTNLLAQELVLVSSESIYALQIAVLVGTAVGLVSKYLLDRRFIFRATEQTLGHSVANFSLYSLTGVATTALFWGFEFGFFAYFETEFARILGAVIGLSLGYVIKYQLDKRYVFFNQGLL